MRWPWSRPTAREISDAYELRLRNAMERAVLTERHRILSAMKRIQRWSDDGEVVVSAANMETLVTIDVFSKERKA